MANNYYTFGGPFIPNTKVRSGQVNPEFAGVESGFDLLPSASDALTRGVAELGIDVQGGTVNEFDVAMPDTRLTNQEGDLVVFRATHTNDGPVVINVDTIGDIAAVEFDGSVFAGGEIVTGRVYEFRYDNANTQFVLSQSTDAANQAISAEDWAIRPEDDPVPVSSGGDGSTTFSALHWSAKSAAFGGGLDFAGDHDASSGDPASPATGNPLYRIITSGGVITGAGQVEIGDDIYWNGVDWNRINNQPGSFTQGSGSDDPTAPGSFDAQFQWQNSLGAPLANVGFNAGQSFDLNNVVHGGGLRLRGENAAGALETYLTGTADSSVQLFFTGLQKFATAVAGVIINDSTTNDPTAGLAQAALINLRNGSFATVADFGFITSSTQLSVKNFVHDGDLVLLGEDSLGVERNFIVMQPNSNGTQFYHNAAVASNIFLSSQNFGIEVRPLVTQTNVDVEFVHGNLDFVGEIFVSSTEMFIEAGFDIEAKLSLSATDTALNLVVMADFDAQTGFSRLAHSDALGTATFVLSTLAAASGGAQVNNTLTGAGFERVLTVSDLAAVGASPFDIASGAAVDPVLTLTENVTLSTTLEHIVSTDITVLRNEVDSGHVQIRGRSSTSVDALMASFDPDGNATFYWDEAQRIRTAQQGPEFIGQGASSVTTRWFQSNGTTLIGTLGFGSSSNSWSGLTNSSDMRIQANDSGGVSRFGFNLDPDNWVQIYHLGLEKWRTLLDGIEIRSADSNNPATPTVQDWRMRAVNASQVLIGSLEFPSSVDMHLINNVHGGNILLRAENAAGAVTTMADFDPDGSAQLYAAGTAHLIAATGSMTFRGGSATSFSGLIQNTAGGSLSTLNISAAAWTFTSAVDSVTMELRATNSVSAATTLFLGDPDTDTRIAHQGVATVITLASAAGGLSVLNTLTGAGVERVLTQSDDAVTATTAELAAIADAINTAARKVAGFEVFNTTTSIVVWAVGAADGSVWVDATGATAHTPV